MTGKKVGFIGVGTMGRLMAERLMDAGVNLQIFDVSAEAAQHFIDKGVTAAASPRALGAWADILILMLPQPDNVRDCILGAEGAIHSLRPGCLVIDMSTSGPGVVRECGACLADRGINMIDAPVGKNPAAALRGDLMVLMGGEQDTCRSVEWLLRSMGSELHYCGPLGSGQVVKLLNNMVSCTNAATLAEAYKVARTAGVDWSVLTKVMSGTAADSWQLRNTVMSKALQGDFEPAFRLSLAQKDMSLAVEMAKFFDMDSPCTSSALEWYKRASAAGFGELDRAALFLLADPTLKNAKK